jgi:hypothetical protein
MAAQSGVVFPASMAGILAKHVEICFGSFTATSTALAVVTSSTASAKATMTSDAAPNSGNKSKTHPPKPFDIIPGMERVIDMLEETLPIYERAQRSTQDAPHRKTFPSVSGLPATCTLNRR